MTKKIYLLLLIPILIVVIGGGYFWLNNNRSDLSSNTEIQATPSVSSKKDTKSQSTTPASSETEKTMDQVIEENLLKDGVIKIKEIEDGKLEGTLAFIRNNNLWVSIDGVERQLTYDGKVSEESLISLRPANGYYQPTLSPNLEKVVYFRLPEEKNADGNYYKELYVKNISTEESKKLLEDDNLLQSKIHWFPNSEEIIYIAGGDLPYKIKKINVTSGEVDELSNVEYGKGCLGRIGDPASRLADREGLVCTGSFSPSSDFKYFAHANSTMERIGANIFSLESKKDTLFWPKYKDLDYSSNFTGGNTIFSPDNSMLALYTVIYNTTPADSWIESEGLDIFDFENQELIKRISTEVSAGGIVWSRDGKTIYYVSLKEHGSYDLNSEISRELRIGGGLDCQIRTSSLWKVDLITGIDEKIAEFDAHNIEIKYLDDQNSKITVSLIENSIDLYKYLSEKRTLENVTDYYPRAHLVEVDLSTKDMKIISRDTEQASYIKILPESLDGKVYSSIKEILLRGVIAPEGSELTSFFKHEESGKKITHLDYLLSESLNPSSLDNFYERELENYGWTLQEKKDFPEVNPGWSYIASKDQTSIEISIRKNSKKLMIEKTE